MHGSRKTVNATAMFRSFMHVLITFYVLFTCMLLWIQRCSAVIVATACTQENKHTWTYRGMLLKKALWGLASGCMTMTSKHAPWGHKVPVDCGDHLSFVLQALSTAIQLLGACMKHSVITGISSAAFVYNPTISAVFLGNEKQEHTGGPQYVHHRHECEVGNLRQVR
jgi:hypothetical protein